MTSLSDFATEILSIPPPSPAIEKVTKILNEMLFQWRDPDPSGLHRVRPADDLGRLDRVLSGFWLSHETIDLVSTVLSSAGWKFERSGASYLYGVDPRAQVPGPEYLVDLVKPFIDITAQTFRQVVEAMRQAIDLGLPTADLPERWMLTVLEASKEFSRHTFTCEQVHGSPRYVIRNSCPRNRLVVRQGISSVMYERIVGSKWGWITYTLPRTAGGKAARALVDLGEVTTVQVRSSVLGEWGVPVLNLCHLEISYSPLLIEAITTTYSLKTLKLDLYVGALSPPTQGRASSLERLVVDGKDYDPTSPHLAPIIPAGPPRGPVFVVPGSDPRALGPAIVRALELSPSEDIIPAVEYYQDWVARYEWSIAFRPVLGQLNLTPV